MNMLSALAVRQHGLQDDRWQTKDKITQYKGLVHLFQRDKKILDFDTAIEKKKQKKELKNLQKEIERQRRELDNAIRGDRQMLRTTLQENRSMQLAFQELHPLKVIDNLHQQNFNKRKQLDRLGYNMQQKQNELISLKLELAELEDNLKSDDGLVIPVERQAQIVTGKVQDAILKREAALSVQYTYKKVLDIMKQDALYFDAVLNAIKIDSFNQSKCMLGAIQMGQLATEYLDDRITEFKELEKIVKRDMHERNLNLKQLRDKVKTVTDNMHFLIRRDSDINIGLVLLTKTESELALRKDLDYLEEVLTELKNTFEVPKFEDLNPCILEQDRQRQRLEELLQTMTDSRDTLLNKKNHATLAYNTLANSMVETTLEYKTQKQELLKQIKDLEDKTVATEELCAERYMTLAQVRTALLAILQFTEVIQYDEKAKKKKAAAPVPQDIGVKLANIPKPKDVSTDAVEVINSLEERLTKVIKALAGFELTPEQEFVAYKLFEGMNKYPKGLFYQEEDEAEGILAGFVVEDPTVPSRLEIKQKSQQLYDLCSVDPDLIPQDDKRKRRKKKK